MTLPVQHQRSSCTAFPSLRSNESRRYPYSILLRPQCRHSQRIVPQNSAHTPLQQLQSRSCSLRKRCAGPVRTAAHGSSTADRQCQSVPLRYTGAGAAALLALFTGTGGAAPAAEAGDAGLSQGPDLLTTVLFSATILALLVLTIGVVYLSATSFFDRRTENEARKKYDEAQKSRELQAANVGKPKVKRRRTQDELSRGGGKGFGG